MDKNTQAKREKQAQDRLQKAILGIASISGMTTEDFKPLEAQVRPSLRHLYQLETLTGILENAAKLMEPEGIQSKAKARTIPETPPEPKTEAVLEQAPAPKKATKKKAA